MSNIVIYILATVCAAIVVGYFIYFFLEARDNAYEKLRNEHKYDK